MSLSQSFSQKIGNVRPLNPCPSLDIDFANGGYVNTGGFANQESVGSANFKIGAFNGPDPIFARSSAATFRGSNGLIQYAPENLLSYSEDFSTSWGKPAIGVSSNVAVSPAGTSTADLIYPSSSGSAREIFVAFTYTSGLTYTASLYAKYAGKQWITLGTNNGTVANRCAWFDLLSGVKGQVATGYQSEIESIGNGWYRLKVVISGSTSPYFDIGIVDADGSGVVTKNGTDGAYVWGAQLERSSAARPYISTTTTARYGPRFEYDLSGNPLGLLMEEQSQNLIAQSENLTGNNWTVTNTTVASSASISPTGSSSFVVTETAATGAHAFGNMGGTVANSLAVTSGMVYTGSFFIKKNSAVDWVQINFGGFGFGTIQYANFNLSTGVIGNYAGLAGSPKIENCGNGWYRCSMSVAATATTTTNTAFIAFTNNLDQAVRSPSYAGSTSNSVLITMLQFEQKPFATSYMPTVGGTSTRNADVVSSTISSWFNQTEGTVVVSGDRNNNPTLNASGLDSFFEFTGTASYLLVHACDGTTEAVYDASGSPATTVGVTIGSLTSIAASYSDTTDLLHISRNGLATQSGPSTGLGVAPTTLNIGYAPVSLIGYWNGHIKSFRYFPKALPNNLQRLSS